MRPHYDFTKATVGKYYGRTSAHDCEKSVPKDFLASGYRRDGEKWKCPVCGQVWIHVCDEAEGSHWLKALKEE